MRGREVEDGWEKGERKEYSQPCGKIIKNVQNNLPVFGL